MNERIGFYICHCGINIASQVRCDEVARYIGMLPGVSVSRDYLFMCSDPGQEIIEKDIADCDLTRVVVASCSPRMHESTFREAAARGGLNPFKALSHVCIREHVSWVHGDQDEATEKAKTLCRAGVLRVAQQRELRPARFKVNERTLVIGGGIAGMQAALDVASAGHPVCLVEQSATIGGHMLQYDKTFPTLDCAACIGTPKMVSVAQQKNIELLSYSRVEELSGFVGNFKAKVRMKARYVDEQKCTGCGDCAYVCPVEKPSEWDAATRLRKAIYRPFPQAVPSTFVIDKNDRAPCVQACPAGTNVQGYVALIKEGRYLEATQLILTRLPFPRTLGRICPAPCEAECRRRELDEPVAIRSLKRFAADQVSASELALPSVSRKDASQRVAVIGAGPAGLSAGYFLARMGYPVTLFEALPVAGGMMRTGIPDFRLPPQVLEQEIQYIERLGVEICLSTPIGRKSSIDELFARGFRAVFAAAGTQGDARLCIDGEDLPGVTSGIRFLKQVNLEGSAPLGEDVVIIGGGAVAVDVARTALRLGAEKIRLFCLEERGEMPAWQSEIQAALLEGIEIHDSWGPRRFQERSGRVAGVELKRCVSVFDDEGRFAPEYDDNDTCEVSCDTVLVAIGQVPERSWTEGARDLPLTERGYVRADPVTFATERPGLFAGGELYTGPSIVVQAVANGHEAAISIDRHLRGQDLLEDRPERPAGERWSPIPSHVKQAGRAVVRELPRERRSDFS
ncbi:FAD-dependent oxidoreductase, partial [Planctomycetota bacterium]